MRKKILTILGARPQFIKASAVSRAIKLTDSLEEIIIHTGQHFDVNMSDIFFKELNIPVPHFNLGIKNLSHGAMVGRMLEAIEKLIEQEKPDTVVVYGDTNSTLAGALAASKLKIPLAHVEAGLRSYNFNMPEETNRILTDRISSLLLCPTERAVNNLKQEGFPYQLLKFQKQNICNVGDVMLDTSLYYRKSVQEVSLDKFHLKEQSYVFCTLHRQENTDNFQRLKSIFNALKRIAKNTPVVLSMHPRTKLKLLNNNEFLKGLTIIDPLSYITTQRLLMAAKLILTDSGGIQKEAYFYQVPCVTLRDETEWTETVELGWNKLVGADEDNIVKIAENFQTPEKKSISIYGDGSAAKYICKLLNQ